MCSTNSEINNHNMDGKLGMIGKDVKIYSSEFELFFGSDNY
jgi:hypothetical protein